MDTDRRNATEPETEPDSRPNPDASDVVDGPIGSAHLVDPTDAEQLGADLEALPAIDDTESADAGDGPPADSSDR